MGLQAAAAGATALHRPRLIPARGGGWLGRRRLARAPLPAAQARRGKEESSAEGLAAEWKNLEVSPALAAQTDDLVQMLPDPANPPESLLDDGFDSAYLSGSYLASASGSDPDWQAPGGNDWLMSDFFDGASGPGSGPAGSSGQQGDGGGGAADNDFFALRSTDWAESIANEVGEGNSFRQQQRERYAPPIVNMTNLAHATEEDLLLSAEQQAYQEYVVDTAMDEAMTLHHGFMDQGANRYAVSMRISDLMEEIELDDSVSPLGQTEEQVVPSWCRANFRLRDEWDAFTEAAQLAEQEVEDEENERFQDQINDYLRRDRRLELLMQGDFEAAHQLLHGTDSLQMQDMLDLKLPGLEVDELTYAGDASKLPNMTSQDLAEGLLSQAGIVDDVLAQAGPAADRDFLAVLSGAAFEDEEDEEDGGDEELLRGKVRRPRSSPSLSAAAPALGSQDEEDEDEEDEDETGERGGQLVYDEGVFPGAEESEAEDEEDEEGLFAGVEAGQLRSRRPPSADVLGEPYQEPGGQAGQQQQQQQQQASGPRPAQSWAAAGDDEYGPELLLDPLLDLLDDSTLGM